MRICFDTNILVYAADRQAGERHLAALRLIERATRCDCAVMLQTLGEFFAAVTRKGRLDAAAAATILDGWRAVFPIYAAEETALDEAIVAVREHRFSFWDAMLWATVQQAGCDILLTEDLQDGRKLGRVTFINPFNAGNAALLDALLPA